MRLNRGVTTLAAVASLAAASAPAAHASAIGGEGGGGLPPTTPQVTASPRDTGSTDWSLIAIGAGGAVVLVGAGVGGSRAYDRRRASRSEIGAARIS